MCRKPSFAAAAAAVGPASVFRAAAEQHPVVDRARQHRRQAQRSALVRADAGQHDLRRRVQLAHRPQHPRGKGLHLLAGLASSPASPTPGFYRFSADVRNEVTGATLTEVFKEIDKLRAEGSERRGAAGRESVRARRLPDSDRDAERPGQRAEHRLCVRAAEGLSRNVPIAHRRGDARAGQERRRHAARLRELGRSPSSATMRR